LIQREKKQKLKSRTTRVWVHWKKQFKFSTKTHVLSFSGIAPRHVSTTAKPSGFYRWFTKDDPVVEEGRVVSIIDAIQELEPERFYLADTSILACKWDHFIVE
jgi:hypothetical protein